MIELKIDENMNDDWNDINNGFPTEDGNYLCVNKGYITDKPYIEILGFSTNLYKLDKYDFNEYKNKKQKCGFYDYDSNFGYQAETRVTHWMELPILPKEFNK